ncbi:MAG: hypothetical protein HJJLKODD_00571 [Phycisphaerae bacterium]|nr:hypothetical protein [Phycisphaerae bacterium]
MSKTRPHSRKKQAKQRPLTRKQLKDLHKRAISGDVGAIRAYLEYFLGPPREYEP